MSTYYTRATNRNGNYLKIPVESKHLYNNTPTVDGISLQDKYGGASGHKMGYKAEPQSATILYCSNFNATNSFGWRWQQGTSQGQVIGNKIMIKSVKFHFEFALDGDSFLTMGDNDLSWTNNGGSAIRQKPILKNNDPSDDHFHIVNNQAWRRDFRLQIIHFEQDLPTTEAGIKELLAKWYDNTYVPTVIGDTTNAKTVAEDEYGFTNVINNKVEMKRESTPYTGKFKLIKDMSFTLNQDKPYQFIDFSLDPQKQVNLVPEPEEVEPGVFQEFWYISDDWWLNTVIVLWNPMNYDTDMDPQSANQLKNVHDAASVTGYKMGNYRYWQKLTYYDV